MACAAGDAEVPWRLREAGGTSSRVEGPGAVLMGVSGSQGGQLACGGVSGVSGVSVSVSMSGG